MTVEEFLYQLNPNSEVFGLGIDNGYTEEQLVLFAKLYHENELKKLRVGDVSNRRELLIAFKTWEVDNDIKNLLPDQLAEFYLEEIN